MSIIHIILLAIVQGAAELLPVSSSAHVIVAEKLLGLDPSTPAMTFLLVMLHTGTMFAVLLYFWPRWRVLNRAFFRNVMIATGVTGVAGLGLKKLIEEVVLKRMMGETHGELEMLFKSLPLIAAALLTVGLLILWTGMRESVSVKGKSGSEGRQSLSPSSSFLIGAMQGLCLPFRGFSRSGATISTGMLLRIPRGLAEDFSFALAVVLTPPVVAKEFLRLLKSSPDLSFSSGLGASLVPGLLGMVFSFVSGYFALRLLSSWLEAGRWKYFGYYCIVASVGVYGLYLAGF